MAIKNYTTTIEKKRPSMRWLMDNPWPDRNQSEPKYLALFLREDERDRPMGHFFGTSSCLNVKITSGFSYMQLREYYKELGEVFLHTKN